MIMKHIYPVLLIASVASLNAMDVAPLATPVADKVADIIQSLEKGLRPEIVIEEQWYPYFYQELAAGNIDQAFRAFGRIVNHDYPQEGMGRLLGLYLQPSNFMDLLSQAVNFLFKTGGPYVMSDQLNLFILQVLPQGKEAAAALLNELITVVNNYIIYLQHFSGSSEYKNAVAFAKGVQATLEKTQKRKISKITAITAKIPGFRK